MKKEVMKSYILLLVVAALLFFSVQNLGLIIGMISGIMGIFSPIFLGIIIAFVVYKPYVWLSGTLTKKVNPAVKKIMPVLSIIIIYIFAIMAVIGVFAFVVPQLAQSITLLSSNIGTYQKTLEKFVMSAIDFLNLYNIDLTSIQKIISDIPTILMGILSTMFPAIFDFTSNIFRVITDFVIALVIAAYILIDKVALKKYFSNIIKAYLPEKTGKRVFYIGSISFETFSKFLVGQLTEAVILGSMCFVGMLIFGFEYPMLIAVLIGITSLIPVAGAFIGAVPSVFLLLMINPVKALWFIVFILALQQIEGNFIYPRVVGGSIGLPAIWVLSAIIVGGGLAGIRGMLVGVPVVSIIYQIVNEDVAIRLRQKNK